MTADFLKNGRVRTGDCYGTAVLTCLANDLGYEQVFAYQLERQMDAGDVLVAISSSGESQNILLGVEAAKSRGADVLTLTGFNRDNSLRKLGDWNMYVASDSYGVIESLHNAVLQILVDKIKEDMK